MLPIKDFDRSDFDFERGDIKRTFIALSLLSELGEVNSVFVTHCECSTEIKKCTLVHVT
jgi:hypothetical protein